MPCHALLLYLCRPHCPLHKNQHLTYLVAIIDCIHVGSTTSFYFIIIIILLVLTEIGKSDKKLASAFIGDVWKI